MLSKPRCTVGNNQQLLLPRRHSFIEVSTSNFHNPFFYLATFLPTMPVLETLGGALFGAVLQVLFAKVDSHQVLGYFRGRDLDEKLLKELKWKLMDVNAVIDDAEQKQFSNSLVKEWVDEVRDALYDAEDLLEQIDYEFSKTELKADFQTSASKVRSFESQMEKILEKLESLWKRKIVQDFEVSSSVRSGLGVDKAERVPKTTRHFSTMEDPFEYREFRSLSDAKGLRTFLTIHGYCRMSIQDLISNFKFLRVLSLSFCRNIEEVPDTVDNLIHLRLLDLSELPSTLHELTNLRLLELMGTTLRKVPLLLGELKNLQLWMGSFEVGNNVSEFNIQQLEELDLHGELSIKNIENIVNPCDALVADLKNKTHLVGLHLERDLKRNIDDSIKEREVLENLQPSKHLEKLKIDGYCGTEFPNWLSDNSLSNVVSLVLMRCKHCLWLPSLGHFTFLKDLTIDGLDSIGRIDADFYGNSGSVSACLETLSFTDMKEWEEWHCIPGAFPNLQRLTVKNCPKLKGHLPEQLSHLMELTIKHCDQLVGWIPRAVEIEDVKMEPSSVDMIGSGLSDTPLEYLIITSCPSMNIPINHCYHFLVELEIRHGCDSLKTFPLDLFPKLRKLILEECCNLQVIPQEHPHSHLKLLEIIKCSEFESFSNEGLFAPQLESFRIVGLEKLKSMPKRMSSLLPSLNNLFIFDCPEVEFSEGCLPSNLNVMFLLNCFKLVASLKGAWGTNPSLKSLYIHKVDLECFPDEGLLPPSLTKLSIDNCPNLKKLNYRGLCHLSSLQRLSLYNCPILQCLPEEGLPESISELEIKDCPLLK
ncbi:disease resistance protein RPM1 [Vigna unguiculata]|uniref:Disease resistance protein RPM1 n=1 Tax=Vigna unguiculata TaxID=3917 RepID=A0A4D6LAZ6_VIGUN|nr:disease resistance protein RPM1 [Vigna unguiculata]